MSSKRKKFDKSDSSELGEKAEKLFRETASKKGWEISNASKDGNKHALRDLLIQKNDQRFKVDVKFRKRINSGDAGVQYKWIWIELHGVWENDRGWLYDGEADLIAFETQ